MKFRPSFTLILPRFLLLLGLLVGLSVVLAGVSTRAHAHPASTITVSNCSTESGPGTLGTDIGSAISGDTINFSCSGTIPITTTLTISKNLTLDGSGQTVTLDGGGTTEVLFVSGGVVFTLNHLTIAHGSGGLFGGGLFGGGLDNLGTTTITNSTFFSNNSASGPGGGLFNNGGTVSVTNSTFSNNSAGSGGGLENFPSSTATITNSTFSNNSAFAGGGLENDGTMTITNSTIANNSTSCCGGGLDNEDSGTATITNSTIANNSASSCCGGGFGGGLDSCFTCTLKVKASIVANNTNGNCAGSITDQGYNLDSATNCGFAAGTDLQSSNPLLGPLANNGGPTQTLALLVGSPAIDHIPTAQCPATATDQRGMTRPDDPSESTCDIGAYESNYPPDNDLGLTNVPANITVNATSPQGAVVTYTSPTVVDEDSPLPPVSCTPASGSTFPIGTTTVTCPVSDSDDTPSSVSQNFTVTVNDTDLGLTNVPANITTNATSPQGATVTYTPPTVVDEDSTLPLVSCTPASGSTFAIGTTTVTCTVSDSDDTPSSVSKTFTVTVKGVAAQISDLITKVSSFQLASGLQTSLDAKLQDALTALGAGDTATACSDLTDFINEVNAQSGKMLTMNQANQLIAAAQQIQAVLAC